MRRFHKHLSVPLHHQGRKEEENNLLGPRVSRFPPSKQTRSYSKVQSWNKMIWVLIRWMIYLSVIVAKLKPLPSWKETDAEDAKNIVEGDRTVLQNCCGWRQEMCWEKDGECVSVQAVSVSMRKGCITANSLILIWLWFWPSWVICVNQNLFVSFLFQAFLEAAKNVFCICPYADFCLHVAGNNSPDLYQPFPRNSSNSFKKHKREKSSGKEQDGVSHSIFRKTSVTLKHQMNL